MSNDNDPPDRSNDRSSDPIDDSGGWLANIVNILERLDRLSQSDRTRSDRSTVDYDISIRSGLDGLEEQSDRDRPSGNEPIDVTDSRHSMENRPRRKRFTPSRQYHVATRKHEDELVVTADVGNVDSTDVTVGFDDGTLVIGIEGNELERVEVPWTDPRANGSVRNGVLTVTIRPDSNE